MIMFAIHSLQSTLIAEPVKFVDGLGIKPTGYALILDSRVHEIKKGESPVMDIMPISNVANCSCAIDESKSPLNLGSKLLSGQEFTVGVKRGSFPGSYPKVVTDVGVPIRQSVPLFGTNASDQKSTICATAAHDRPPD